MSVEYPSIIRINIAKMDVRMAKMVFIIKVFRKYLPVSDLSLEISRTVNVLKPKSIKTAKIPVKAKANDNIPNPSAPKYRAIYNK